MFRFKQKRVHDTSAQQNFEQLEPNVFDVGDLKPTARSDSPGGWLQCDGTAISRTEYPALFQAIGTTFGVGDGSSTFNLPDLQGRVPVGAGDGTDLTSRTLGDTGGEEATADLVNHTHGPGTLNITSSGAHSHSIPVRQNASVPGGSNPPMSNGTGTPTTVGTGTTGAHAHPSGNFAGLTASEGTADTANVMQPFTVINWLIKT